MFKVTVSNGVWEEVMELVKDGRWVNNGEDARKMAQSMINSEWKVVNVEEEVK